MGELGRFRGFAGFEALWGIFRNFGARRGFSFRGALESLGKFGVFGGALGAARGAFGAVWVVLQRSVCSRGDWENFRVVLGYLGVFWVVLGVWG